MSGAYSTNDRKAEGVWHSVLDFLDACDGFRGAYETAAWSGGDNYSECRRLALTGWDEEVVLTDAVAARVADKVWAERTIAPSVSKRFDVSGCEVDIDRFLTGEPECLVELVPHQVARAGRAVRLVIHNGVRAQVTPEVYRGRGAAVVTLLDALARAGHPLEIWAGSDAHGVRAARAYGSRSSRWSYVVKIQDAADPLDIGRVCFFASHPGAHRQLGFAVRQSHKGGSGDIGGSEPLGPSCVPNDETGTTIVLPQLTESSRWTDDEAAAWVVKQLDLLDLGDAIDETC